MLTPCAHSSRLFWVLQLSSPTDLFDRVFSDDARGFWHDFHKLCGDSGNYIHGIRTLLAWGSWPLLLLPCF